MGAYSQDNRRNGEGITDLRDATIRSVKSGIEVNILRGFQVGGGGPLGLVHRRALKER